VVKRVMQINGAENAGKSAAIGQRMLERALQLGRECWKERCNWAENSGKSAAIGQRMLERALQLGRECWKERCNCAENARKSAEANFYVYTFETLYQS
jgi:hypothetical protein